MAISIHTNGNVARMSMSGRFDFKLHREFKDAYGPLLDNAAVREIEVELNAVDYLDSSALGMLMLLNERAKAAGKSVVLVNPSSMVYQVLQVANFDKLFNVKRAG